MGLISVQYNLHCIKYTRGCGGVARPPTNILHEVFCNNNWRLLAKFSVSDVCGDSSYNSVRCVYDQWFPVYRLNVGNIESGNQFAIKQNRYFLSLLTNRISRAITAESSPLHIVSNRIRTGSLWFPSASR